MADQARGRAIVLGCLGIGISIVTLAASSTLAARDRPWDPPPCSGDGGARVAAARDDGHVTLANAGGRPQYRLDPVLDTAGTLTGQRLVVGIPRRHADQAISLPAESFASGPFGRLILVGADDGVASRLSAVDADSGCASLVAVEQASVIRRAVLDPDARAIYEMRVDRTTRADRGIWRRALDTGVATRILEPIPPDGRFGQTWSTELGWSMEEDRLMIQSCGQTACRTRVLDPATRRVTMLADPRDGVMVGLAGGRLVSYRACRGLPCPLVAVDVSSGDETPLSSAAWFAVLAAPDDGPAVVVHEIDDPGGLRLARTGLDGGPSVDLGAIPDGLRLHRHADPAAGEMALPGDWLLLTPRGVVPAGTVPAAAPDAPNALVRPIQHGFDRPLEEVIR